MKQGKGRRKKCHWCQRSDSWNLTKCSSCQKKFFCMDCIKERSVIVKFIYPYLVQSLVCVEFLVSLLSLGVRCFIYIVCYLLPF